MRKEEGEVFNILTFCGQTTDDSGNPQHTVRIQAACGVVKGKDLFASYHADRHRQPLLLSPGQGKIPVLKHCSLIIRQEKRRLWTVLWQSKSMR